MGNKLQNEKVKFSYYPSTDGELVKSFDYSKIPESHGWYFYFAPNGDLVYHGVAVTDTLKNRLTFEKRDAQRVYVARSKGNDAKRDSGWDQCEDSTGKNIPFDELRLIVVALPEKCFTESQINAVEEMVLRVIGSTGNGKMNTGRRWIKLKKAA